MSPLLLFFVTLSTFLVGGMFFVKGTLEKEPWQRIKLSLYGFSFMLLGYFGNNFLGGY